MMRLNFKSGQVIIREGEYSTDAYLIESGEVSILKGEKKVAVLKENESFGEIGCLEHKPRTATVVALTPLTLRVLKEEDAVRLKVKNKSARKERSEVSES